MHYTRVMLLLASQLAATAGTATAMRSSVAAHDVALQAAPWAMPLCVAGVLVSGCLAGVASSARAALALLFAFTACESVLVGYATMQAPLVLVGVAGGGTALFFVACCVLVGFCKVDFGWLGGALLVGSFGVLMGGVLTLVVPSFALLSWLTACGVALFCGYVLYDLSMLVHRFGPDDAVVAALCLYADIVGLFVYVLQCLTLSDTSTS